MPEMSKRKMADRVLDEVVGLRRPQSLLVELSSEALSAAEPAGDAKPETASQRSVLNTSESSSDFVVKSAAASRRQIIIE